MVKKLLILILIFPIHALCQERDLEAKLNTLRGLLQQEVEKRDPEKKAFVTPNDALAFSEVYKKVFSTVVLGKTDAVANGSALSYSQDNNKGVFSFNIVKMPKKRTNWLLDGGLSLKSKDNSYAYYQKGKWSNDITLKMGIAYKLPFGKGYWNKDDAVVANKARTAYFDKEYQKYRQVLAGGTSVTMDSTQREALKKELENPDVIAAKIMNAYGKTDDATKPYHGYRIAWINLNTSYTNSSFAIVNDSVINEDIQEKFSSVSKASVELNFNFHIKGITKKGYKNFFISQVYGRFNRVSILDNVNLIDKKIKVSPIPVGNDYSLYYYDSASSSVTHFGKYDDIHAAVLTADYGIYLADFFCLKEQLGFTTKLNFTTPYGENKFNFERNYSVLFGPIFRLAKDKLFSAATFTLNFGFENAKYTENAWDKFVLKASAAIPFNVFEKSK